MEAAGNRRPIIGWRFPIVLLHLLKDEARQILAVHKQDIFISSSPGKVGSQPLQHLAGELEQKLALTVIIDLRHVHEVPNKVVFRPLFPSALCRPGEIGPGFVTQPLNHDLVGNRLLRDNLETVRSKS